MKWIYLRACAWVDTRARFVAKAPPGGTLLDLGSSDGETLGHIAELRPDLRLFAADFAGTPENDPAGCQFQRADLERDRLPWAAGSMDAVTCMHLVEHLREVGGAVNRQELLDRQGTEEWRERQPEKTDPRSNAGGGA